MTRAIFYRERTIAVRFSFSIAFLETNRINEHHYLITKGFFWPNPNQNSKLFVVNYGRTL